MTGRTEGKCGTHRSAAGGMGTGELARVVPPARRSVLVPLLAISLQALFCNLL
jgi:hypothetical protein